MILCGNWFSIYSNSDLDLLTWKAIPWKHFGQGSLVWSLSLIDPRELLKLLCGNKIWRTNGRTALQYSLWSSMHGDNVDICPWLIILKNCNTDNQKTSNPDKSNGYLFISTVKFSTVFHQHTDYFCVAHVGSPVYSSSILLVKGIDCCTFL